VFFFAPLVSQDTPAPALVPLRRPRSGRRLSTYEVPLEFSLFVRRRHGSRALLRRCRVLHKNCGVLVAPALTTVLLGGYPGAVFNSSEFRRTSAMLLRRSPSSSSNWRAKLGQGAFSRVYECVHAATGDSFAVKIVDFRRWQLLRSFSPAKVLREANIMKTLQHPNIVKLEYVHSTPSAMWLVQELAEGAELFQVIVREGKLEEVRARFTGLPARTAAACRRRARARCPTLPYDLMTPHCPAPDRPVPAKSSSRS
jgi:hypothetical protein